MGDLYKIEIRRRRGSKAFSYRRYPGFRYCKDGRYAFHWERTDVEGADAEAIERRCREDRFAFRKIQKELVRSGDYRARFIAAHPGPWRCRYCGRRLEEGDMTVDHLVPASKPAKSKLALLALHRIVGCYGVNDLANLVPSCRRCNTAKSDKMGAWFVWGMLGKHRWMQAASIVLAVAAIVAAAVLMAPVLQEAWGQGLRIHFWRFV